MARYEIRVKGRPVRDWGDWFREMRVQATGEDGQALPELLLAGALPDQSALLGVLMRLHNLNLTILSVRDVEEEAENNER